MSFLFSISLSLDSDLDCSIAPSGPPIPAVVFGFPMLQGNGQITRRSIFWSSHYLYSYGIFEASQIKPTLVTASWLPSLQARHRRAETLNGAQPALFRFHSRSKGRMPTADHVKPTSKTARQIWFLAIRKSLAPQTTPCPVPVLGRTPNKVNPSASPGSSAHPITTRTKPQPRNNPKNLLRSSLTQYAVWHVFLTNLSMDTHTIPLHEKFRSFLWPHTGQDFKLGLFIWLYRLGTLVNFIFILPPICMLQLHAFRNTRHSPPASNAQSQRSRNNSPNQYLNSLNMIWNKTM